VKILKSCSAQDPKTHVPLVLLEFPITPPH
jgi:hypothetical protein